MAQIINISNSVDSKAISSYAMQNDDEDGGDEHHQLLASLSNINVVPIETTKSTTNVVTPLPTIVDHVQNCNKFHQNETVMYADQLETQSNSSTSTDSPSDSSSNLPMSNSENSLNQPLLNEGRPQTPTYNANLYTEEGISSSNSSTTSDNSTSSKSHRIKITYFYDMLISAFLITPLLNIHWRGAWDLLDIHLLPDNPYISALISLGVGFIMLFIIYLIQGSCQTFYEKYRRCLIGKIMTRFHTVIVAFAYIQQWRGVWNLMDLTPNDWYYLLAETAGCILVLIFIGEVYNLNSAPFLIGVDTESYFIIDPKYRISKKKLLQRSMDFIFYEIIEAPFLIIAWHGLYNLSDSYISPDNKQISTIISFSSGYGGFFFLATIQIPVLRYLIKLGRPWIYSCVSNIFHLTAFISVVQIWRSLWLICEQYLNIADNHDLTLWLCYGGSLVVLICGLTVCSLNGPAGSKDNGIDESMPSFFQFDYFSIMLPKKKTMTVSSIQSRRSVVTDFDRPPTIVEVLTVN